MKLGCIPDLDDHVEEDLRERHIGRLVGTRAGALLTSIDHSSFYEAPKQQAESCVGWALSTSVFILARLMGRPIERPSPKAIYDFARLVDSPNVLIDNGCRPRAAIVGVQEYGFVAESRWTETATNANEKPTLDIFRAGCGAMLSTYYRIGGGDVATMLRIAIAKGFVPLMAMPVDQAFMDLHDGSIYDWPTSAFLGNHAMAIIGYGPGYFLLANSWGAEWGVRGVGRVSDRVMNTLAFDVLVATIAPQEVT